MILYIENSKDATRKLLFNEFDKARHSIILGGKHRQNIP